MINPRLIERVNKAMLRVQTTVSAKELLEEPDYIDSFIRSNMLRAIEGKIVGEMTTFEDEDYCRTYRLEVIAMEPNEFYRLVQDYAMELSRSRPGIDI